MPLLSLLKPPTYHDSSRMRRILCDRYMEHRNLGKLLQLEPLPRHEFYAWQFWFFIVFV